MNIDQVHPTIQNINSIVNYKKVGEKINELLVNKGFNPKSLDQVSTDAIIENAKTFRGDAVSLGSGLIQTNVVTPIVGLTRTGGVFIGAGANYKDDQDGNVVFNGVGLNLTFQRFPYDSITQNEVSEFFSLSLNLEVERADIKGAEDVLARTPDMNSAIAIFEQLLQNEKLRLSDVKAAAGITGNASVPNIDQTTPLAQGQITASMVQMLGNLGELETLKGTGLGYFMNQRGYSRLLREQSTTGAFINAPRDSVGHFEKAYNNGARPTSGFVGNFDGIPVYITSGILNTYSVNATTKAVTAQTGGTNTVVTLGLLDTLGIASGKREFETISVFDPSNDRTSYLEGTVMIGARTRMAAGVLIPAGWNVASIPA